MFFPSFLLTPAQVAAQKRRDEEHFEEHMVPNAIPWDEDKFKYGRSVCILGETFTPQALFRTKAITANREVLPGRSVKYSPGKRFAYVNKHLSRGCHLQLFQGQKQSGRVCFTTDITVPVLVKPKYAESFDDTKKYRVWMSYTPAEVLTCRQGIRRATGTVMVGGLGLGYMLRKIAEKKSVKRIIVVEISQELLDWYGTDMCKRYEEEYGKPIEVICGDAKDHVNQHGEDVRHVVDIWDSFPTSHWELNRNGWNDVIRNTRYFWGWGLIADPADYR